MDREAIAPARFAKAGGPVAVSPDGVACRAFLRNRFPAWRFGRAMAFHAGGNATMYGIPEGEKAGTGKRLRQDLPAIRGAWLKPHVLLPLAGTGWRVCRFVYCRLMRSGIFRCPRVNRLSFFRLGKFRQTGCFARGLMQSAFAVRMVERSGRFPVEEGGFPAGGYRFSGGVCGGGREVAGGRGGFRVILEAVSGWRRKNRRAGRWCGGWPAGCCSVVWGLPEGFRFMPKRCRNRCGERYRPGRWRRHRG